MPDPDIINERVESLLVKYKVLGNNFASMIENLKSLKVQDSKVPRSQESAPISSIRQFSLGVSTHVSSPYQSRGPNDEISTASIDDLKALAPSVANVEYIDPLVREAAIRLINAGVLKGE